VLVVAERIAGVGIHLHIVVDPVGRERLLEPVGEQCPVDDPIYRTWLPSGRPLSVVPGILGHPAAVDARSGKTGLGNQQEGDAADLEWWKKAYAIQTGSLRILDEASMASAPPPRIQVRAALEIHADLGQVVLGLRLGREGTGPGLGLRCRGTGPSSGCRAPASSCAARHARST
jgi:hypothetical protein